MDEPIPYTPTDKAMILTLTGRVEELEGMLRHLDRHSLDLWLYAQFLDRAPDATEWAVIVELIMEVRDAYGLRTPDR
jgi:hypothetical protein